MTQAACQRPSKQLARGSTRALLLGVLLVVAGAAAARQQAAPVAPPASAPAPRVEQDRVETRGVSAQAATDAVASQLPQSAGAEVGQERPIDGDPVPLVQSAPDASGAGDTGMRGVLFRVTPPAMAALPAESLIAGAEPGSGPAVAGTPPQAPRASYLLATIHFGTPEEQGIDYAVLEQTLGEVETFVNEANLDEAWKPEYDDYRWLPVEQPLSKLVGPERFAVARALLPRVPPQDLDRMKPWSVLALLEARGESGGDATMDARLQRMAAAAGKRVLHLESLEEQLKALDCVPAQEHARVLDERLAASWVLRIESAQAMAWYRARNLAAWLGDIDRMEGLGDEARAVEQRARRCLLEDRNARWLGQLQTLFQDGACLVAVGAVHLPGAEGLIAALRRDGYTIEAMPL